MTTSTIRVQKHRDDLRKKGLKLIQLWVPDDRAKKFKQECHKQSMLIRDDENNLENLKCIELTQDIGGWE